MSSGERCKECRQWVPATELKCLCGWKPARVTASVSVVVDHCCKYQARGRRCTLPGSMSPSTHGSGTWYCQGHYLSLGDPKKGEEWLDYVEKHYAEIMEARRDWRSTLHTQFKTLITRSNSNEN